MFKKLEHAHQTINAHVDIGRHLLSKLEFQVSSVPFERAWKNEVVYDIPCKYVVRKKDSNNTKEPPKE